MIPKPDSLSQNKTNHGTAWESRSLMFSESEKPIKIQKDKDVFPQEHEACQSKYHVNQQIAP
jgi:hypothetical protein